MSNHFRIDNLPSIICFQYFVFYQVVKLRKKQISPEVTKMMNNGFELYQHGHVQHIQNQQFLVKSSQLTKIYNVTYPISCECIFHQQTGKKCKHIYACDLAIKDQNIEVVVQNGKDCKDESDNEECEEIEYGQMENNENEDDQMENDLEFNKDHRGRPKAMTPLQSRKASTKVQFSLKRGRKKG